MHHASIGCSYDIKKVLALPVYIWKLLGQLGICLDFLSL